MKRSSWMSTPIEEYCPICGVKIGSTNHTGHRCPNRSYAAIDAANTRAIDEEDDQEGNAAFGTYEKRPWSEKLAIGFEILHLSDE